MKEEDLLKLSVEHPFPLEEIRHIFISCHKIYAPSEIAVNKCKDIMEDALSMNINLRESYLLQFYIDFELIQ